MDSNKVLKYTPDGYVLTDSIDSIELPNTDEIDSYYHSILNNLIKSGQEFVVLLLLAISLMPIFYLKHGDMNCLKYWVS